MTVLAIKEYLKHQVAELDLPVPVAVYTQRPKAETMGSQSIIVFEQVRGRETRFTLGRPVGRKRIVHLFKAEIFWLVADEQTGGDQFDLFLDRIDKVFRLTTIPTFIYDPLTNEQSTLVFIGEEIDTEKGEQLLDEEEQGMAVLTALKTLTIEEHVTG